MRMWDFIMYNHLLSDANINQVGQFLAAKNSTTWTDL